MARSKVKNLKELLKNSFGDNFEIIEENYSMLTSPGEHYGSIMLALDLRIKRSTEKEEVLNLVAKLLPVNEMLKLAFHIEVTTKKEVCAYLNAIPTLVQFQREHNAPEKHILDIFPECFGARITLDQNKNEVDDDAALIFENLKVRGYEMEDRLVGFDYDHAKLIIKDLAKFHAVPIALRLLKPNVFKEKIGPCLVENYGLERLPKEVGEAFHNGILENSARVPDLEPYLERIKIVVDAAAEEATQPRPPPKEPFVTTIHTDYWVNNTMILRNNVGKPIKNKMVDLQLMSYCSPIHDLVFFLFTSVINSVLEEHYDDLIKLYHNTFIEILEDFPIDLSPFSWEAFQKEFNEVAPTETYHILVMLKPIFTDRGKVTNTLEEFQDSDWSRKDLLGPTYFEKLRKTVLILASKNLL